MRHLARPQLPLYGPLTHPPTFAGGRSSAPPHASLSCPACSAPSQCSLPLPIAAVAVGHAPLHLRACLIASASGAECCPATAAACVLHPSTLQPRLHSRAQPSQHYRLPPHALHVTRTRMRTDTNLPPVTPLPSPVSRSSRPFSPATSPPAAPAAPSVPLARQFSFWPFTHTLIGSHGRPDNPLPSLPPLPRLHSRESRLRHPFLAGLCSSVRAFGVLQRARGQGKRADSSRLSS